MMFGHDDSSSQNGDNNTPMPDGSLAADAAVAAPAVAHTPVDDTAGEYIESAPAPMGSTDSMGNMAGSTVTPIAPAAPDAGMALPGSPAPAPALPESDALLDIKQQALQQLTPLVGHLDQSPEEKFRTTMMMIQASDNQSLIKTAYEAAQQITDEKARAQALLDVVNEINYFTQNGASDTPAPAV